MYRSSPFRSTLRTNDSNTNLVSRDRRNTFATSAWTSRAHAAQKHWKNAEKREVTISSWYGKTDMKTRPYRSMGPKTNKVQSSKDTATMQSSKRSETAKTNCWKVWSDEDKEQKEANGQPKRIEQNNNVQLTMCMIARWQKLRVLGCLPILLLTTVQWFTKITHHWISLKSGCEWKRQGRSSSCWNSWNLAFLCRYVHIVWYHKYLYMYIYMYIYICIYIHIQSSNIAAWKMFFMYIGSSIPSYAQYEVPHL